MLAGMREILIISTPEDLPNFKRLLGNRRAMGDFIVLCRTTSAGRTRASLYNRRRVRGKGHKSVLVLGDNIFYGHGLTQSFRRARKLRRGELFAYHVRDPENAMALSNSTQGHCDIVEEKPEQPRVHWAVTGLISMTKSALHYARELKPSPRGELEITDLNRCRP